MKKLSRFSAIGLLFLVVTINSCQQSTSDVSPSKNGSNRVGEGVDINMSSELEDLSVNGDVKSQDGILHFRNLKSFLDLEVKLRSASSQDQKAKLLNVQKFESLSEAIYKAYEPLRDSTRATSLDEILFLNQDILEKRDGGLLPKGALAYSDLINREGLVYIGKVLYKFTRNQEIIVSDGDIAKARGTGKGTYKNTNVIVLPTDLTFSSSNGRMAASPCSTLGGTRWNNDGKRAITYGAQFQQVYYLTSGSVGTPSARYYISHYTYNVGYPYKVSPAFSYNFSPYNTDNHFFVNYKIHYSSAFTGYSNVDLTPSSGSELVNYDSKIVFTYSLGNASNLTENQMVAYTQNISITFEGGIAAFGNNTSQYGYYYSTGVPLPIYMACP